MAGEQRIWNLQQNDSLFPDSWHSLDIKFYIRATERQSPINSVLRLFTELGPKDFYFTLNPRRSLF
jgi:hypothetical protein